MANALTYRLPDGRFIQVAYDLCRAAFQVSFELAAVAPATRGQIVMATLVRGQDISTAYRAWVNA